MRKLLIILIPILLLGILGWYLFNNKNSKSLVSPTLISPTISEENLPVDFTATFEITTNGTPRTFTNPMYHNLSQDVFIEDASPNTVNVKRNSVTWDDFFKTLPFSLSKDCLTTGTGQTFCSNLTQTLRFVLNGTETPDALDLEIKPNDKLEVVYGN